MALVEFMPWISGAGFLVLTLALARGAGPLPRAWLLPAGLSGLFLGWTAFAAAREGPLAFWVEHTRNLWGNQIWFDLLFAVGIAWWLILPRARAQGIRPLPWLAFVVATGTIGLLALVARVLYLEQVATPSAAPE